MDQIIYLKYLQTVLKKFNIITISNENNLIQYFQDDFYLLIRAELDKRDYNFDNKNKIIKKAIHVKIKASYQPLSEICKIDTCYS